MEEHIAEVSRSRDVNMFGELSDANRVLLENATQERAGYVYERMSCIIVCAFKFEAFLNHIGARLFPDWGQLERLPHRKKLKIIASHLAVDLDAGRRPFQTLFELFRARNALAHGRPESLRQRNVIECGTLEDMRRKMPLTEWESTCTIAFAQRTYEDTEEIAELLWKAAGYDLHELRARGHGYSICEIGSHSGAPDPSDCDVRD